MNQAQNEVIYFHTSKNMENTLVITVLDVIFQLNTHTCIIKDNKAFEKWVLNIIISETI